MPNVGKNIKKVRTRQNMNQEQLAEKVFVTRQTVSSWENGKSQPDIDMLMNIAEALGIDVNELIYGKKITPPVTNKLNYKRVVIEIVVFTMIGIILWRLEQYSIYLMRHMFEVIVFELVSIFLFPSYFFLLGWEAIKIVSHQMVHPIKVNQKIKWIYGVVWAVCTLYLIVILPITCQIVYGLILNYYRFLHDEITKWSISWGWSTGWQDVDRILNTVLLSMQPVTGALFIIPGALLSYMRNHLKHGNIEKKQEVNSQGEKVEEE